MAHLREAAHRHSSVTMPFPGADAPSCPRHRRRAGRRGRRDRNRTTPEHDRHPAARHRQQDDGTGWHAPSPRQCQSSLERMGPMKTTNSMRHARRCLAALLAAQASSAGAVTVSSVEMSLANSQKYYLVVDGKPAYQTSVHPPRPPSRSMAPRTITFPVTGAWTTYQQLAISTSLNSGSVNTVRIGSAGEDAGNIDEIEVR